jgi:hypothetical protein
MTRTLIRLLMALAVLGLPAAAPPAPAGEDVIPEQIEAVSRALQWLADNQNPDGSWTAEVGFKLNQSYKVTAHTAPHVGVTALAGMAFLAAGHLPDRGPYGKVIADATRYLLSRVNEEGYITANGTRMYSHAFATLFLAEVYGMTHSRDVGRELQAAVNYIVECQNEQGSWRYVCFAVESDMSITVCQLNALRAARNVGIRVPRSTIDRAAGYVARSYVQDDHYGPALYANYYRLGRGSFKYQATRATRSSFALTAAGLAALHNAGVYSDAGGDDGIDLNASVEFLKDHYHLVSASSVYRYHYFYWYGHYYATQALYVVGGQAWDWYFPRIRRELIEAQRPDGSMPSRGDGPGPAFSTSVAAIILSVPYGYLPIFQR